MSSNLLSEHFLQKINVSTRILQALDHPLRQRILYLVEDYSRLNAEAISNLLQIKSSLIAQHLDILRQAKILEYHLEGKQFFYSVNQRRIYQINDFIKKLNRVVSPD